MSNFYTYDTDEPIFSEDIKKLTDEQKDAAKREYAQRVQDFKDTFSTPHGERVFIYLMHEMYLFRNYGQHNASAYALEGKREIANELVDMLTGEYVLERLISAKNQFIKRKKTDERSDS